jgi:uracil-DNA glycosylase
MFFEAMHPAWQKLLADQRQRLDSLEAKLAEHEALGEKIAPSFANVMRAFSTDPHQVRVLIVGQDPYPTEDHAIGLSFAVSTDTKPLPRSLQNIMKELASDIPEVSATGRIERWAERGVMLLNRHLTTAVGEAGAHSKLGWDAFTDVVIRALVSRQAPLVALLWGNQAAALAEQLESAIVLRSAHPSPLSASRGFFGSRPFSAVNRELIALGAEPIDWNC